MGNVNAADDAKRYRDGYPGKPDDATATMNLEFYQNKRSSKPDGDKIDVIHQTWKGKYGLLEAHHGYIQWLFPIREDGLNSYAQQLQLHEAQAIRSDPTLQNRIILSYELMLDFYGMKLVDRQTGQLERAANWASRYDHLNHSFHNYLRITRILKCLGEMGLEHYKLPFVSFVLKEIIENKQLNNCYESCVKYWAAVLRNEADRKQIETYLQQHASNAPRSRVGEYKARFDNDSDEEDFKAKKRGVDIARGVMPAPPPDNGSDDEDEEKKPEAPQPAVSTEEKEEKKETQPAVPTEEKEEKKPDEDKLD